MDSTEINKIAGGVLAAGLLLMLLHFFSGKIYGNGEGHHHEEPLAFALEIEEASTDGGTAKPAVEDYTALVAAADVAAGEKAFKKCKSCHKLEEGVHGGTGPSLYGVVGRDIASVDYGFSDALKGIEGDWNLEALSAFLKSPKKFASGTKMSFGGIKKAQERVNLIAYLNELDGSPIQLVAAKPAEEAETKDAGAEEKSEDGAADEAAKDGAATDEAPKDEGAKDDGAADDAAKDDAAKDDAAKDESAEDGASDAKSEDDAAKGDDAAKAEDTKEGDAKEGDADDNTDVAANDEGDATKTEDSAKDESADAKSDGDTKDEGTDAKSEDDAKSDDAAKEGDDAAKDEGGDGATHAAAFADGDAAAGKKVFRKCRACHKVEEGKHGLGPSLYGIINSDIASAEGYDKYSEALTALPVKSPLP